MPGACLSLRRAHRATRHRVRSTTRSALPSSSTPRPSSEGRRRSRHREPGRRARRRRCPRASRTTLSHSARQNRATRPRKAAGCSQPRRRQDAAAHARSRGRTHRGGAAQARQARVVRRNPAPAEGGRAGSKAAPGSRWRRSTCPGILPNTTLARLCSVSLPIEDLRVPSGNRLDGRPSVRPSATFRLSLGKSKMPDRLFDVRHGRALTCPTCHKT